MSNYDKLSIDVRLSIIENGNRDEGTLGKGVFSLLQGITEFGSLNRAAKNLGMAYSKAWRIVKDTEAALGMQLLDRDGAHGSTLTEAGDKLLDAYVEIDAKLQEFAEQEFAKVFK